MHLWAGLEPTVSRVGDRQVDQLALSGTDQRPDDMDRLADLGVSAVRFPLLWERTAPDGLAQADWTWGDIRLRRLQARGVQPIVGLIHHGSGPRHTHLLDPDFVAGLVDYARAVAQRYPEITCYTPVNEPLTTARFSGLYGHWYPHGRDEQSCWTALNHQLRATVLAMQAIREVNPQAQLIQTEDLGCVFSTPVLRDQADFENERRWLTFDLLLGRFDETSPLWAYLRRVGASERDLLWFAEHPCPPEVLGLNVYVTSERFLDHRLDDYPAQTHGGNGRQPYADVEAVRVLGAAHGGPLARLHEAHARYGRPLALTEVHLNCTREEQLRWLAGAWQAAQAAREAGVEVRAVTAWATFGAFEWNSLLTRREGHYESGLWDLRAPVPRPTALARLAQTLATGAAPPPLLETPGWWQRDTRHVYPPEGAVQAQPPGGPPLLVYGAHTSLGQRLLEVCGQRGLRCQAASSAAPGDLAAGLDLSVPWAVVNLPGALSARAAVQLAQACAASKRPLLSFCRADVFDGLAGRPYTESDPASAVTAEGQQAARLAAALLSSHPAALLVRSGELFGTGDPTERTARVMTDLLAGKPIQADAPVITTPTYAPDLFHEALNLLLDGEYGLWHLTSGVDLTPLAWAHRLADVAGLATVPPGRTPAPTHQYTLRSERGWPMPHLDQALTRFWTGFGASGHAWAPLPSAQASVPRRSGV
nr:family 1 glycosylhydrolase [Deinococcus betulae]